MGLLGRRKEASTGVREIHSTKTFLCKGTEEAKLEKPERTMVTTYKFTGDVEVRCGGMSKCTPEKCIFLNPTIARNK